ncbi:class II aldolase/adducin family protein [Actinomadura syzygii]|uniref:Class II aldolase/adducin family protein n=1 Tax=Actinomadura syzygii TaxID=1427538 RepID=A0A5D0TVL3_9ACTN|nr:class II aldolase/adducin family protein [Actinomadura syzygii]TYC09784.1 class II aldolase/adducin family protein [Actinomadura syzygii]
MTSRSIPLVPPEFSSVEEERRHRKERLAAALRLFAVHGFEDGVAGHITARDPGFQDHFWINPIGMPFSHIRVSDLILVNDQGEVVEGEHRTHEAPFSIHSAIYRARADVQSAAHSHSIHGRAVSSLGEPIEPITQDSCAFYNDHGYLDDYTGVVLDEAEGKRLAAALGDSKAVILRNHGLLTVGTSVDAATWWFISMERSCQAQLLAKAAGKPIYIDDASAALTHRQLGGEFVGWLNFQPLYHQTVRTQPDLLE